MNEIHENNRDELQKQLDKILEESATQKRILKKMLSQLNNQFTNPEIKIENKRDVDLGKHSKE